MKYRMYTFHDTKAKTFSTPFAANNDLAAIREFEMLIRYSDNMMSKYPEDFDLGYVGTFDNTECRLEADPQGPIITVRGRDLKMKIEKEDAANALND